MTCKEGCGFDHECGQNCPAPPTGNGTCAQQTPGSCSSGSCGEGKSCVSVGNPPNDCACTNDPPDWAGSHDGNFGLTSDCKAWGWVTNLKKPNNDILIHIYSDAAEIYSGYASEYRSDLTPYCYQGTCAFNVNLWDLPNSPLRDEAEHNIWVGVGGIFLSSGSRGLGDRKITCVAPPTPIPPSCVMSGLTTVIRDVSAQYCVSASNAPNGAEIWKSPTSSQNWEQPPIRAKSPPGCSWTSFAGTGTYYVVCNAYGPADNPKCSGNPFGLPPGWGDCGPNDALTVTVITPTPPPPPTPTPTPTPTPVMTIKARAVEVYPSDTSCTAIRAVPTTDGQITGTTLGFTPGSASQPAVKRKRGQTILNTVTFCAFSYR